MQGRVGGEVGGGWRGGEMVEFRTICWIKNSSRHFKADVNCGLQEVFKGFSASQLMQVGEGRGVEGRGGAGVVVVEGRGGGGVKDNLPDKEFVLSFQSRCGLCRLTGGLQRV